MGTPTTNLASRRRNYLKISDAAAIMNISAKTLYKMFDDGRIPSEAGFVRWFDHTIRIREDMFLPWLDSHHSVLRAKSDTRKPGAAGQPKTLIQ